MMLKIFQLGSMWKWLWYAQINCSSTSATTLIQVANIIRRYISFFGKVPNQRFLIVSCIKIADYFLASEVLPVVAKTTTVVWERPVF